MRPSEYELGVNLVDQSFYRLVKANPPTESDFYSYRRLGMTLIRDVPDPVMLDGVSVYDSLDFLVRRATNPAMNQHGRFIVAMIATTGVAVHKTGGRHHFTLVADPKRLLLCVNSVVGRIDIPTGMLIRD